MKTGKTLRILALLTIFLGSTISHVCSFEASGVDSSSGTVGPEMYVSPSAPEAVVGQNFTIDVNVSNLTATMAVDPDNSRRQVSCGNLYGFDLQLAWDPTVIKYVSHTKKIPVETNVGGVLHQPTISVKNQVDESATMPGSEPGTRYWLAEASMLPAAVFNGNGTFVTMVFNVLKAGQSPININFLMMADKDGLPLARGEGLTWLNPPRNATFSTPGAPVANFTYSPNIGVVNKAMTFNASSSQSDNTIVQYMWNFSGTTVNTTYSVIEHIFTESKNFGCEVTLRVLDNFGVTSGIAKQTVNVATTRDLVAKNIVLPDNVGLKEIFTVETRTENLGTTEWVLYENATTRVYYNTTVFDLSNMAGATWVQMGSTSNMIGGGVNYKRNTFTINSSQLPTIEAIYYFLVNVTGIPAGYEYNVTNNVLLSTPVLYTALPVHKLIISSFSFGLLQGRTYKNPVIEGELTTFNVTVKNEGNVVETANVTISNGTSVLLYILMPNITAKAKLARTWSGVLAPGTYNLTAQTQAGLYSSTAHGILNVVRPPHLVIEYSPLNPTINEKIVFNASASRHLDPRRSFKSMTWKFYGPGFDENALGSEALTVRGNGSNNVVMCALNTSGTWTVVLDVTDADLYFQSTRQATEPYRLVLQVAVTGGFSLDPMIIVGAAALIVVLVIAIVLIMLRRRRGPVVPTSTE